jgi:nucleoside-diphosphate-sugar epimerase
MNILITGGNGYIASTLYNNLHSKYNITKISRSDFDLTNHEETKKWFIDKHFDVVIHTAIKGGSRLQQDTEAALDQNLKMYYNLLDNSKSFDRFISIGSGAELYSVDTPYGLSKHVIRHSMLNKKNFYNVRVFAVFDENELDTRFIKGNIQRYIKKEPIVIHQDKKMDFFYMVDFVKVIDYYITESSPPKEFDCTYNRTYYLSEIAEKINNLSDYNVPVEVQSTVPGKSYMGTPSEHTISYVGLDEGIKRMHEWMLCKI